MPWDEPFGFPGENVGERGGINAPVTIVEGGRRELIGTNLTLDQIADYTIRKLYRSQEQQGQNDGNWGNGFWPFGQYGPDMVYSVVNGNADQAIRTIGGNSQDALYVIQGGIVCKVLDSGAGTLTVTVTYYDILAGPTTITQTLSLSATGSALIAPVAKFLLGGGNVTVSCGGASPYGAAKFDAFVGLWRVA
jgi:hypothetical protein